MNRSKPFAIIALLMLASCASGRDFSRPPPGSLILGETTKQQAIAQHGDPNRTFPAEDISSHKADRLMYFYSTPGFDYGFSSRNMNLYFVEDVLVGYYFESSFESDSTNFDHTKRFRIKKGEHSCDEVIDLLGPPPSEGAGHGVDGRLYPIMSKRGIRNLRYNHLRTERGLGSRLCWKELEITCNEFGLVTDIQYSTTRVNPPWPYNLPNC